jgi:hypothetical protein
MDTVRHEPLGRCMYCEDGKPPFTDEHVMPRGLNGDLLFPKSCCARCQKIIGYIETAVLKSGWLSDPRLVMGLRSYKPKKQPAHVKMTFANARGRKFTRYVRKEEAVALISMPGLIAPRYLTNSLPLMAKDGMELYSTNDAIIYRGAVEDAGAAHSEKLTGEIARLCRIYGATKIDLSSKIVPPQVIRFLCKVAHGFHIWERGLFPLEESPAIAILKSERTDYSNWTGSKFVSSGQDPQASMHEMSIEDVTTKSGLQCVVVNIALFNHFGPKLAYQVITHAPGWQEHVVAANEPRRTGDIHLITYR